MQLGQQAGGQQAARQRRLPGVLCPVIACVAGERDMVTVAVGDGREGDLPRKSHRPFCTGETRASGGCKEPALSSSPSAYDTHRASCTAGKGTNSAACRMQNVQAQPQTNTIVIVT